MMGSQKSSSVSCCSRADPSCDCCCTRGEASSQAAALTVTGVTASLLAATLLQAKVKCLQTLSDVAKLVEICWVCTAFQWYLKEFGA